MTIAFLFWTLAVSVCVYAAFFGGWEGRWFAIFYLGQALLLVIFRIFTNPIWSTTHWPTFAVDFFLLIALFQIAIRTSRFWPLWVFGFHLITISAHLASLLPAMVPMRAYFILATMWSIPKLLAVVIGIAADRRSGLIASTKPSQTHRRLRDDFERSRKFRRATSSDERGRR